MTKLKRLLAALALVLGLGFVGVAVTASPASAYLTQCQYSQWNNGSGQAAYEICWNHVNNGGLNQVRVVITCYDPVFGGQQTSYGPWVGQSTYSTAYCQPGTPNILSHTYQLR